MKQAFIRYLYYTVIPNPGNGLEENYTHAHKFISKYVEGFEELHAKIRNNEYPLTFIKSLRSSGILKTNLFTKEEADCIRAWVQWIGYQSDKAWKKLMQYAYLTGDKYIIKEMTPKNIKADTIIRSLRELLSKQGKSNGITLDANEKKNLRENQPAVYQQYLKLHRELRDLVKNMLRSLVRLKGKNGFIDAQQFQELLDKKGLPRMVPVGFDGLLDEHGNFYTKSGVRLQSNPPPYVRVVMNPKYGPENPSVPILTYDSPYSQTGKPVEIRSLDHVNRSSSEKFNIVMKLHEKMDKLRDKWRKDLMSGDARAVIVEILYLTGARIGSDGTKVDSGVGISTLRKSMIKCKSGTLTIQYKGKKGMLQKHVIRADSPASKKVVDWICTRLPKLGNNDRIFTMEGKLVTSKMVNDYLRSIGVPKGTTSHKFRTFRGTEMFIDMVKKSPVYKKETLTDREVLQEYKNIVGKVAEILGHYTTSLDGQKINPSTTIKYYIDPIVQKSVFDKYNVRYPSTLNSILARQNAI